MQMIAWPYNNYASVLNYTIIITNGIISTQLNHQLAAGRLPTHSSLICLQYKQTCSSNLEANKHWSVHSCWTTKVLTCVNSSRELLGSSSFWQTEFPHLLMTRCVRGLKGTANVLVDLVDGWEGIIAAGSYMSLWDDRPLFDKPFSSSSSWSLLPALSWRKRGSVWNLARRDIKDK